MSDPKAQAKQQQAAKTAAALAAVWVAARADVLRRFDATGSIRDLLADAWRELLHKRIAERSLAVVEAVAPDVFPERVQGKVDAYAEWLAGTWDEAVKQRLSEVDVLAADLRAEVERVMSDVVDTSHLRADSLSVDMGNFAAIEEATIQGHASKTWRIQGATTRPTHEALAGATIPIEGFFANGLQYPGAPGPPEERVNCDCYLTFEGA